MSIETWLAIIGAACTATVTVTTWGFFTGRFSGGAEEKARRLADDLSEYKAETLRRFNDANRETSKAWSYVQTIEARFMRDYASRELVDARFAEHRREFDRLRIEMDRFKDVCNGRHQ